MISNDSGTLFSNFVKLIKAQTGKPWRLASHHCGVCAKYRSFLQKQLLELDQNTQQIY